MRGPAAPPRPAARLRRFAAERHSAGIEVAVVVLVYCLYDSSRGILGGGRHIAVQHARLVFDVERWAHIDIERPLQAASSRVPGLVGAFDAGYVTLHLSITVGALMWLYRAQVHTGYARLRTALVAASSVSLLGFTLLPTAPPRLAGIGVADTVSRATVNLNSSPLHWLYNPYAALPSVHMAYATLVGYALLAHGRHRATRALGVAYPLWVALEVIVTGNHFVVDVVSGALVAGIAWWAATHITAEATTALLSIPGGQSFELRSGRGSAAA